MGLRRWGFLLAATALLGGLACSKPAKVTLSPKQVTINDSGATRTLQATVFDAKDRPMEKAKVTFASSSPEIAEVDAGGKVTVRSSGDTVVTATCGKVSGAAKVTVRIVSSLKLELPEGGARGPAGAVVPLVVLARNEKGEPADLTGIAFSSSDPAIASVDPQGMLTLLASGSVTLVATIGKSRGELLAEVHVLVPVAIKVPTSAVQTLQVGETTRLDATVLSDLGDPMKVPLTCSTSSDKVATVDSSGMVTGVGKGTAEITIMAGTARNTMKVIVR